MWSGAKYEIGVIHPEYGYQAGSSGNKLPTDKELDAFVRRYQNKGPICSIKDGSRIMVYKLVSVRDAPLSEGECDDC